MHLIYIFYVRSSNLIARAISSQLLVGMEGACGYLAPNPVFGGQDLEPSPTKSIFALNLAFSCMGYT